MGLAQVQDLRDLIAEFRTSGKPAVLYSETIGEGTGATILLPRLCVQRDLAAALGQRRYRRYRPWQPFLKGLLDRFGVKANVIQRKNTSAMKGDSEHIPRPAAKRLKRCESFFDQFVAGIAKDRALNPADVRRLIDKGPLMAQKLDASDRPAGLSRRVPGRDQEAHPRPRSRARSCLTCDCPPAAPSPETRGDHPCRRRDHRGRDTSNT